MKIIPKIARVFSAGFFLLVFCVSSPMHAQGISAQALPDSGVKTQVQHVEPTTLAELLTLYPAGSIRAMETARQADAAVEKLRSIINAQLITEQNACYPQFFTTSCLSEAKERHRVASAQIRLIEIEANRFKRRENAKQRDQALDDKGRKSESELLNQAKENQSRISDDTVNKQRDPVLAGTNEAQRSTTDSRFQKHSAAVKRKQAAAAESAKQRAGNIAAYENKRRTSEARQREIAAKKLKKEPAQSAKETTAPK